MLRVNCLQIRFFVQVQCGYACKTDLAGEQLMSVDQQIVWIFSDFLRINVVNDGWDYHRDDERNQSKNVGQ